MSRAELSEMKLLLRSDSTELTALYEHPFHGTHRDI